MSQQAPSQQAPLAGTRPAATQASSSETTTKRADSAASSRSRLNSPAHMTAARRHSLYGHDDRIVIDPGSRVWKVGFSGEAEPRACFWAPEFGDRTRAGEVWDLDVAATAGAHGNVAEARRLVQVRIERRMRDTFHKHLLIDGKQRKVVIVENTFLPTYVKEFMTATLFDNLKCPSVAFTPAPVLALAACGRASGLVVDIGWLETTVTPVCFSRPLYGNARTSPIAGRAVYNRLRALLGRYARYLPPNDGDAEATPPPLAVLSDHIVERVLTEACYVPQSPPASAPPQSNPTPGVPTPPVPDMDNDALMSTLAQRYDGEGAVDWTMAVPPPRGVGRAGRLVVPGWVRARAAEVLFGDGPDEDATVPELVLRALESVPVDVRAEMASSVLVTGGTACMPGVVSRVRAEVYTRLPADPIELEFTSKASELASWKRRLREPYAGLQGLAARLAVLNDPAPLDGEGGDKGGAAPRWSPSLVAWVGGSLAGALKTSAPELVREDYDTRVTASMERGEAFRAAIASERDDLGAAMAAVGLDIDDLGPGVALGPLAAKRKRGWAVSGSVPDWTTARVRAG